jgi:hypothetical protein
MVAKPRREFDSKPRSFTADDLRQARKVIAHGKKLHWTINKKGHRSPCFDIADVEWLLGYIDSLITKE